MRHFVDSAFATQATTTMPFLGAGVAAAITENCGKDHRFVLQAGGSRRKEFPCPTSLTQ